VRALITKYVTFSHETLQREQRPSVNDNHYQPVSDVMQLYKKCCLQFHELTIYWPKATS